MIKEYNMKYIHNIYYDTTLGVFIVKYFECRLHLQKTW